MDIIESLQWRYATKKFDSTKAIENHKIERLCEAFNLTATSYGLQPIKLIVVKNKKLQEKLQTAAMNQIQVSTASHVLILCIESNMGLDTINNFFDRISGGLKELPPALESYKKIMVGDINSKSEEQLKLWATKQAYIALGNLMTVCAVEKIDACPMEGFIPIQVDEILELNKQNLASVLMLPIGIRASDDTSASRSKIRKATNDIITMIS